MKKTRPETRWVERLWVISSGAACLLFSTVLSFSFWYDGLAVARRSGRFILVHGTVQRDIGQLQGLIFFIFTYALAASFVAVLVFGFVVFSRNLTIDSAKIFPAQANSEAPETVWLRLASSTLVVPILIYILKMIFRR